MKNLVQKKNKQKSPPGEICVRLYSGHYWGKTHGLFHFCCPDNKTCFNWGRWSENEIEPQDKKKKNLTELWFRPSRKCVSCIRSRLAARTYTSHIRTCTHADTAEPVHHPITIAPPHSPLTPTPNVLSVSVIPDWSPPINNGVHM